MELSGDLKEALKLRYGCVTSYLVTRFGYLVTRIGYLESLKIWSLSFCRIHDADENVRFEVVNAIVAAAKKNFEVLSRCDRIFHKFHKTNVSKSSGICTKVFLPFYQTNV